MSAVETEAPVNLTYELSDAGGDETGHNALLSWKYPEPGDLQYGWITLVYELQYQRVSEADNWKVGSGGGGWVGGGSSSGELRVNVLACFFAAPQVKPTLREPQLELLSLPVGDYLVRVRCRSRNSQLWSKWSATLLMSVPSRPSAGGGGGLLWQQQHQPQMGFFKLKFVSLVLATY